MTERYDFQAIVDGLNRYLRLRSIPIGMKLFETVEEMEAIPRIRRPRVKHTTDQIVAQARQLGWTVGITMNDLVASGLLPSDLVSSMDAPPENYLDDRFARTWQPYRHQVAAWEALSQREPRSVIVTTGTASGKTECFLVPILADLARELSDCPSGTQGGNLGQVSRGSTVPELETFLYNLEDGQLCPVAVESRYGFHVVRLDRKLPGRDLPFETVAARIAACTLDRWQ